MQYEIFTIPVSGNDEEHFKIFSRLRVFRKQIAENDAVPAYAVFTDAELALFAQAGTLDEKKILQIEGIGKKRMEKYGMTLLKMLESDAEAEPRNIL